MICKHDSKIMVLQVSFTAGLNHIIIEANTLTDYNQYFKKIIIIIIDFHHPRPNEVSNWTLF